MTALPGSHADGFHINYPIKSIRSVRYIPSNSLDTGRMHAIGVAGVELDSGAYEDGAAGELAVTDAGHNT